MPWSASLIELILLSIISSISSKTLSASLELLIASWSISSPSYSSSASISFRFFVGLGGWTLFVFLLPKVIDFQSLFFSILLGSTNLVQIKQYVLFSRSGWLGSGVGSFSLTAVSSSLTFGLASGVKSISLEFGFGAIRLFAFSSSVRLAF